MCLLIKFVAHVMYADSRFPIRTFKFTEREVVFVELELFLLSGGCHGYLSEEVTRS